MTVLKDTRVRFFILTVLVFGFVEAVIAESGDTATRKVYRSYSGSASSQPKTLVIRDLDSARQYKMENAKAEADNLDSMRARPIYEELNGDVTEEQDRPVYKKVYRSRSGSGMASPKIVVQK